VLQVHTLRKLRLRADAPDPGTERKDQLLERAASVFDIATASELAVDLKELRAKIGSTRWESEYSCPARVRGRPRPDAAHR